MHNIQHLTLFQIGVGTAIVIAIIYIAYFFERHPSVWDRLEENCPLFRFGDSRQPPLNDPPPIQYRLMPRDPSEAMLQRGVALMLDEDIIDLEDLDDLEARRLVHWIWTEMWAAQVKEQ